MTKNFSKSLWVLLALGVLVVSSAAVAGSATATDVEAIQEVEAAAPAVDLGELLETPENDIQVDGQECEVDAIADEDNRVFLWGPTNPNCPYKICGGYNCNSNADCCGAFGGDGYCRQVPEGNNYCVCP